MKKIVRLEDLGEWKEAHVWNHELQENQATFKTEDDSSSVNRGAIGCCRRLCNARKNFCNLRTMREQKINASFFHRTTTTME